jgi:NitT/TauT family transport system substrate-binding protein
MKRRDFVRGVTAAAALGALETRGAPAFADGPPESPTVRLDRAPTTLPGVCTAPVAIAEDLLKAEGLTDVRYRAMDPAATLHALAAGEIDFTVKFVGSLIARVDAGDPIVMLGGVHTGCFELFASQRIHAVRELKGKTIGVTAPGSGSHLFLLSLLSYVGLNPSRDVTLVTTPREDAMNLFAAGKLDAYQAFAEEVQELRARKAGHVLMSSTTERPWSLHFCCLLAANQDFVRKHPSATKRVTRAILKASAICALEPERAARFVVDRGVVAAPYEIALATIKSLPYTKWREYDPEDAIRFYAVRLHEVGMIRSSPQKILAQGTDWRFVNELKRELKS